METVSGVSNWKLVIRREERSVRILRGVTCDERAVLPEELFGLPVTELGGHALSPTAPAGAEGEEVLVSCGLTDEEAQWDNRRLTDLTLPAALQKAGDYALLNCSGLKTLRLHDSVTFWGGGALMNCRSLDTFFLTRVGEQQESLSFFADELSRELDVTIYETDGQTVHLIFPEFVEAYEENCPAHHFDYNIYGAGYPYHHCFRQKKLSLREYDTLWKGFLGMEHDEESGVRLAWWRLRCPAELTEEQAKAVGEMALRVHKALGLAVYSRTDMILDARGQLWVLEANSLPGMTPNSFVPKEAAAVGISYDDLCEEIVQQSLKIKRR